MTTGMLATSFRDSIMLWLSFSGRVSNHIIETYDCLVVAFFFCLTWLASETIQLIIDDVETYTTALYETRGQRVKKWQRRYCLISSFIEEIERFFQLFLFILVTTKLCSLFLFIAKLIHLTLFHPGGRSGYILVIHSVVSVIRLLVVILGTHNMKMKVIWIENAHLFESDLTHFNLSDKAQALIDVLVRERYSNNATVDDVIN